MYILVLILMYFDVNYPLSPHQIPFFFTRVFFFQNLYLNHPRILPKFIFNKFINYESLGVLLEKGS